MESIQRRLEEVKRVIDDDNHRRRVLTLCQQSEPKSFDEYSSSGSFRKLEKFESSTYSEVLKAIDLADNNKPVVMKIMRALSKGVLKLLPSLSSKGCQSYNDILNELVVTQALSQLHEGVLLNGQSNALYKTHFFCQIHEIKVVSGNMEKTLSKSKELESTATAAIKHKQSSSGQNDKRVIKILRNDGNSRDLTSDNGNNSKKATNDTNAPSLDRKQQVGPSFAEAKRQYERDQGEQSVDLHDEETRQSFSNDDDSVKQQQKPRNHISSEDDQIEEERMLIAALPHEYVVSVMKHDGQPLWWMMTHKKLSPEQLTSVLVQVIVGLAIAEHVYSYEHRDLHVSNILIKKVTSQMIPFVLDGHQFQIVSHGIKATIIDATFSRLTHNGKVYFRNLTSTLRAYGSKRTPPRMSLQNRSYRQMVRLTRNRWEDFKPKTNLIWLTYLAETLMKNEVMKDNTALIEEIRKIRDHTLKVKTTIELLSCFPQEKVKDPSKNSKKTS